MILTFAAGSMNLTPVGASNCLLLLTGSAQIPNQMTVY